MVEARPSCARIAASMDVISTVIVLREQWGRRNAGIVFTLELPEPSVLKKGKPVLSILQRPSVLLFVTSTYIHFLKPKSVSCGLISWRRAQRFAIFSRNSNFARHGTRAGLFAQHIWHLALFGAEFLPSSPT